MGSLCSKDSVAEELTPQPPPAAAAAAAPVGRLQKTESQSLKQLITLTAKEDAAVVAPVVHAVITRAESNAKAKSAAAAAVPPVVVITSLNKSYSTAGAPAHHHRLSTVDVPQVVPGGVPQGFSGEHVIAGWPSWLTSVAGEVVQGWLPRRADTFERLDKIGQGTYSNVYKARDLETGKVVALKRVRFVNMDPESVRFMAREIHVLRRLDGHPNVVRLEGIVTSRLSHSLYLVFEYMDHDLAGLAATPGLRFTEPQVKCLMAQILAGLRHCHDRGVLHRDIKGANLLIGGDGALKIADFGLATFFDAARPQPLTSRVVTLWYRPPELLLGATEYGVAVDLWSTGCILAELLAGKPILPGQTEIEQLHKIFKLCGSPSEEYWAKAKLPDVTLFKPQRPYRRKIAETFRDFSPPALDLLDTLLAIEPSDRGTAAAALDSDFFRSKPLACDPASLPKLPPSKEYDAKLRGKEAAMRQNATAAIGGKGSMSVKPGRNEQSKAAAPAQDAVGGDHQRRQAAAAARVVNPRSASHHYSSLEDSVPGFRMEPPVAAGPPAAMQSGGFGSTWYRKDHAAAGDPRATTSRAASASVRVSNSVAGGAQLTSQRSYAHSRGTDLHPSSSAARHANSRYNRLDVAEPANALDRPGSSSTHQKDLSAAAPATGFGGRNKRIHYSGPLVPPGGNMEDTLREHERQIQQAVRKARVDKERTNHNGNSSSSNNNREMIFMDGGE
ncbi:probable serine/threonine-protein kinase At1g54610 [Oryza glaberrima]|uniref:probable serine/threonine-protein kinase At1g54610 n=1 Tax=Oryza glaberrima TaxID=4538 RepID=UPI00224BFCFA|nr:probable serine/threonine-protein kinase At1g54610 [Oryza glaberrima]